MARFSIVSKPRATAAGVALLLLSAFGPGLVPHAYAHPELQAQIDTVTAEIASQPTNALLFLRRAELHRRHAEFKQAHADMAAGERLQPSLPTAEILQARIFLDEENGREALAHVDSFLRQVPDHSEALWLRGRCHAQLDQRAEAVADFSAAIRLTPTPSPDLLLERARTQAALGNLEAATAGLDEGIKKLGNIPSLEMPTIEYERQRRNFEGALARVDRIITRSPVKEPWLVLRGEILEQAERNQDALISFKQVLAGLETYPPARRGLDLTRQLESRARAGMARVEAKLSPPPKSEPAQLHSASN